MDLLGIKNRYKLIVFMLGFILSSPAFSDLSDDVDEEPVIVKPKKKIKLEKNESKKNSDKKTVLKNPLKNRSKANKKNKTPVKFESLGLRATKEKGYIELEKEVVVRQEDFKLTAKKAKIYINEHTDEVKNVIATGNVRVFNKDETTGKKIKAKGQKIIFNAEKQTVTILGNARLWRDKDLIRGKKILYNLNTGWIEANKVKGIVQPGEK